MRIRTIAIAAVGLSLALPGVALGETLTVDPADAGGCTRGADNTCKTVGEAIAEVQSSDTISIKAGTYAEAVTIDAADDNVTITGASAETTKLTGNGAANVLAIAGDNANVSKLSIASPETGLGALLITGAGAKLDTLALSRAAGTAEAPVLETSSSGLVELSSSIVLQAAGTTNPALQSTGTGGVKATDSIVVSGKGPAITYTDSTANEVIRSTIAVTAASVDVIKITSAATSASAKKLTLDSTILSGLGSHAAAIRAKAEGDLVMTTSTAGRIDIVASHITAAGAGAGIQLDAYSARGGISGVTPGVGNMTAVVKNSIVHGSSRGVAYKGLVAAGNTITVTYDHVDGPDLDTSHMLPEDGKYATFNRTAPSNTEPNKLFVNAAANNYHLRQDAPLVDKGVALENVSATDIDKQARVADGDGNAATAAAPDIGADEFNNLPAVAKLTGGGKIRQNQSVTLDASGSFDPEGKVGGGVASYEFEISDGRRFTQTGPTATVSFSSEGFFAARVTVVDTLGRRSAPSTNEVFIQVTDGRGPTVAFTSPSPAQRISRARRTLIFRGAAADKSGLRSVQVALQVVRRDSVRNKAGKLVRPRALPRGTCEWVTKAGGVARRRCASPLFFDVSVGGFSWTHLVPRAARLKLPLGSYDARVRATDAEGNSYTNLSRTTPRTRLAFRLVA